VADGVRTPEYGARPSNRGATTVSSVVGLHGPLRSVDEITHHQERDVSRLRSVPKHD